MSTRNQSAKENDPVVGIFPDFLHATSTNAPFKFESSTPALVRRSRSLANGVKVGLSAQLRLQNE